MKWTVKPINAGLRVDFDGVRDDERPSLIEALKRLQDGWRGCPAEQVKNITTSMIRSVGYAVTLDVVVKPSARLSSREFTKCFDAMLHRRAPLANES